MRVGIAGFGRSAFVGRLLGSVTSGFLLYAAFPPLEWADAAWVALIPLILMAVWSDVRQAARWGFLAGLVFWLPSLAWVLRLSETSMPPVPLPLVTIAWIGLAACCAIFISMYAALIAWVARLGGVDRSLVNVVWVIVSSLFWIGLEEIRGRVLSGFPWNPLAASQYANLSILQIAALGGAPLVAAVIVLLNTSIALTIARRITCYRERRRAGLHVELMIGLGVVAAALVWGVEQLQTFDIAARGTSIRVGAVQPNIPQARKWSEAYEALIYTRMQEQTRFALYTQPDVIVWPETAIPGALRSPANEIYMEELCAEGVPILAGVMRESGLAPERYYNSAVLFPRHWKAPEPATPSGSPPMAPDEVEAHDVVQIYDKQHLVPFGEYVPLAGFLALFSSVDALGWSCLAGDSAEVFRLKLNSTAKHDEDSQDGTGPDGHISFSVLICFEDVFRSLARRAVLNGARLLVNQTNDAWFDGTAAPRQHMTHTVLRCVENRVPAVRVGNSGLTCAVDTLGRVTYLGQDGDALLGKTATGPFEVILPPDDMPLSRFTRTGSGPYFGCGVTAIICFFLALVRESRKDAEDVGALDAASDKP